MVMSPLKGKFRAATVKRTREMIRARVFPIRGNDERIWESHSNVGRIVLALKVVVRGSDRDVLWGRECTHLSSAVVGRSQ
jgi:hypothetical protein